MLSVILLWRVGSCCKEREFGEYAGTHPRPFPWKGKGVYTDIFKLRIDHKLI